ncbi:hypothetical protein [Novosphingobium sp. AP12]|uniref:hypothetical protein n=1 Tax=Novosphingobium sp. AP12 TaxID=1144305 RepID=UPI00031FFF78|nr:hypothetical protein [Novosphingobium sp. AP12]
MLVILIAGLGLVAAVAAFVRSLDWAAAEHRDNYEQLDIVGRSLESWPTTVQSLARANLLRDRLQAPPRGLIQTKKNWKAAARLDHPDIGMIQLLYSVGPYPPPASGALKPTRSDPQTALVRRENPELVSMQTLYQDRQPEPGPVPEAANCTAETPLSVFFDRGSDQLRMTGNLSMDELWQLDQEIELDAKQVKAPGGKGYAALVDEVDPSKLFGGFDANLYPGDDRRSPKPLPPVFCYELSIPLQKIAPLNSNTPTFRDVVVVGADGRVISSLGTARLPVRDLGDIVPTNAEYRALVTKLLQAAAKSKESDPQQSELVFRQQVLETQRSAKPLEVTVAGESYVAYFRPVKFPEGWTAPDCMRDKGGWQSAEASTTETSSVLVAGSTCLLIGLVPQRELQARLFRLSPDLLTAVTMLLVFAVLLMPAIKLRFLGPAGDMSVAEVATAVFGVVAAVALVTLAGLTMLDMLRFRAQSEARLVHVSRTLAKNFGAELREAINNPIWIPVSATPRFSDRPTIPRAGQTRYGTLKCKFPDGSIVEPSVPYPAAAKRNAPTFGEWGRPDDYSLRTISLSPDASSNSSLMRWPVREGVFAFGELGRAFPGYSALAYRCNAGARSILAERDYFRRAMQGVADGRLPDGRGAADKGNSSERSCSHLTGLHIEPQYTIGAVRAQTDGAAKVIVVNRFSLEGRNGAAYLKSCSPIEPGSDAVSKASDARAAGNKAVTAAHATEIPIGPRSGVILQLMTSRTFLAPVLPRSFSFIVVDGSDPQLPYLFASGTYEIGSTSLRNALQSSASLAVISDAAATPDWDAAAGPLSQKDKDKDKEDGLNAPLSFTAQFAGTDQQFVARKLRGTPWVLIVYRPVNELDQQLAGTAGMAAGLWFGAILIAFGLMATLCAAVYWLHHWKQVPTSPEPFPGTRARLWLWPRPGTARVMLQASLGILAFSIAASIAAELCVWLFGTPRVRALVAIFVPALSVTGAILWLGTKGRAERQEEAARDPNHMSPKALLPADEWGFAAMSAALLIACGAVPAYACWVDAHEDARSIDAQAEIAHLKSAWTANRMALEAIGMTLGVKDEQPMGDRPSSLQWPGLYGFQPDARVETETNLQEHTGSATVLRKWLGPVGDRSVYGCKKEGGGLEKLAAPLTLAFCVKPGSEGMSDDLIGLVDADRPWGNVWRPSILGGVLVLFGLVWAVYACCKGMNRALFGFGIPLDAVTHPDIQFKDGKPDLPERAVVLNGPLALMIDLLGSDEPLDISRAESKSWHVREEIENQLERIKEGGTVVVVGLDIALKDAVVRAQALTTLERFSKAAEDSWKRGESGRLVVMTDLSPLDRILRAYEREQSEGRRSTDTPGNAAISRTEQMRWSKLFEDFKTCTLPVREKFNWTEKEKGEIRDRLNACANEGAPKPERFGKDQIQGIMELMSEVRYLPEDVLHSLIAPGDRPSSSIWPDLKERGDIKQYPIETSVYHSVYFEALLAWAKSVRPATPAAARDYLRGEVIEHYQHLWAASSHAERVLLVNLARRKVINIEAALAIRSLIRRRLVVLDPAPRIVNGSFALFIRQAEKPDTVRSWRREQPQGAWEKIARPLGYLLPIAIVILAALALMAGESLANVLPIVLGAGPALLATILPGRRPA